MSDPQNGILAQARRDLLKLTPRNWLNIGVVLLAIASVVAQRYGFQPLADYGYDAAHARNVAIAFAVGAMWPGSPVGKLLDYAAAVIQASRTGGPPPPAPSLGDINAARNEVDPGPQQIPPSHYSDKRVRRVGAFAMATLSLLLAYGGLALLVHGCGASPLRVQAVAADITGSVADEACQEMETQRTAAIAAAAEQENPALGTSTVATVRAHYARAVATCNLLSDAQGAWADELERAEEAKQNGQPYTLDISLVQRVLATWPDAEYALESVDVHLAGPPESLLGLIADSGATTWVLPPVQRNDANDQDAGSDAGADGGAQ